MAIRSEAQTLLIQVVSQRRKRVLALALPAVGEQVLNTLVGLVDTFLVGHLSPAAVAKLGYSSASALAGVGLANQLIWVALVFLMAVGVGSTALIARARGADDHQLASDAMRQSMLLGLVLGFAIMLVGPFAAEPALRLLGAAPDVLALGVMFLRITTAGFVPAALLLIGTAALRGVGDTRTPLLVMLGVNALNILFSWLLINGNLGAPILGVEGTAIGSTVARGLGGLAIALVLIRGRSGLKLALNLRPSAGILRRILRIGVPSGGEQLVFQGALLIFITFVTGLGTAAYAAHNTVLSIESLSFLPGMGYATATSALVGQALGARQPEEAEAVAYEALWQGGILMIVLGMLMVLFPHQLVGIFVTDLAVIAAADGPMRLAGVLQLFLAINFVMSGALRGAGDTSWPFYTKIVSAWGVRLPIVLLLHWLGWGLIGVWIGMMADYLVQSLLALWRFRSGKWKSMRV